MINLDAKLYPFQLEAVADIILSDEGLLVVLDTGTGKSIIGIATSVAMLNDRQVDKVLLVCERNKLKEWEEDFGRFTTATAKRYHGASRKKVLDDLPDILVTTYETAKTDLMSVTKTGKRTQSKSPGPLLESLKPYKTLVIYDESARLMNRTSGVYKAHEYALRELRKISSTKVVGLTATPIERDWENAFNQMRLISPGSMPTIGHFESEYITYRDDYGRAQYNFLRIPEFIDLAQQVMIRKSKYDPDIRDQFPKMVEKVLRVDMSPEQKRLYEMAEHLLTDDEEGLTPGSYAYLRQLGSYPAAMLSALDPENPSDVAQMLCEALGPDSLVKAGSPKLDALREHLRGVVKGQGAKCVVFTFFGQSILPLIRKALEDDGIEVYVYHGGQTTREAEQSLTRFKASENPCVFLTSDSGAQGINLPEATYMVEFESALTYAKRVQRLNRISRLTSDSTSVHCLTLVATDTVEDRIVSNMLQRNEMLDKLNDDEHSAMTASERRELFKSE